MTTDTTREIRIHRGADAPELHASGAAVSDFGTHDELRDIATRLASSECSLTRLLVHQGRDDGGLSIVYLFFKPNFPLFRHQHDVDSLYVVISGSVVDFMTERCAVIGSGQTKHASARDDVTLSGLAAEAVTAALADARLDSDDVDAVIVAKAPDTLEGVMNYGG